jgi:hypothetical protein
LQSADDEPVVPAKRLQQLPFFDRRFSHGDTSFEVRRLRRGNPPRK